MPTTLQSSRNREFAPCFAVTPQNHVIVVDGINKGRIWDGVSSATFQLGIDAPTAAPTFTTPVGGAATAGNYVAYYRYKDADGNYSSLSPTSGTIAAAANDRFVHNYTASSDTRVTQIELLRSLVGETTTLYVVTTVANATSSFSDTLSDVALAALTEVVIDNPDGTTNANRFDPPTTKRFVLPYLDRMLYFADITYEVGSVELTNGSASVQGRGTSWTDQMVGWKFYVDGQTTEYTVSALNTSTQVITLSVVYAGTTNLFSAYALKREKAHRRRIYYTTVLEPESQRSTDYILPADEGDDYTGGFVLAGSAYICEPRRIWKVFMTSMQGRASANNKPGLGIAHAVYRGLVNNRCWARVENLVYLLDYEGIFVFDGNTHQMLSDPVQDFWRDLKINFGAKDWFFCTVDPAAEVIRWHVSLGDGYLPNHSLVYHYRRQQWQGIEEYEYHFGASVLCPVGGALRPLYGGEAGKFHISEGSLDGTTAYTIRGTATAATALTLTDTSSDAVIPSNPVGATLAIVYGRGKHQVRKIVAYASGVFTLDRPWNELPDTTSEYQVGGILWTAKTGVFEFPELKPKTNVQREFAIVAEPTSETASLDVRRYFDHATTPEKFVADEDLGNGVLVLKDDPDVYFPLRRDETLSGVLESRTFSGRRSKRIWGYLHGREEHNRFVQVELRGVQGMDRVRVYRLELHGMVQE